MRDNPETAKEILASNIRRYLKMSSHSQQELAQYMEVSNSTVSDWCSGRKYPRVNKIEKIAKYFDVPMTTLTASDSLHDVDLAFYGDYRELDDRDKLVLRDMVVLMRSRQAQRKEPPKE